MNKINVLLITVRADHGGGPKHVDFIINNISKSFNLFLACPADKPYYQNWKESDRIEKIFLLPHRKFNFIKFIKLCFFCLKYKIAIVHSHGKGAGVYSRLFKLFLIHIKVIHTFHGIHIGEYGNLKKSVYLFYERLLGKLTDRFINVSKGEQSSCLKFKLFQLNKSDIIYNAIKALHKIPAPRPLALMNKLVITTISRFDFPKNMYLAHEIAKRFRNNPEIVFLWVGDGKDKTDLERLVQQEQLHNIVFTGFTTDIPTYLSWSDIYLSTSKWEGMPYALIEAASLGIPIVASDVTGNNEIVEHGVNGYLYQLNSIEQAVKYLEKLAVHNPVYYKMSKEVKNTFNEKFDLDSMIKSLEKTYLLSLKGTP